MIYFLLRRITSGGREKEKFEVCYMETYAHPFTLSCSKFGVDKQVMLQKLDHEAHVSSEETEMKIMLGYFKLMALLKTRGWRFLM